MLQKNPLCPPLSCQPSRSDAASDQLQAAAAPFLSAEDFDTTGVLAGVDPCESRYWWIPELYGPDAPAAVARNHVADFLTRGPRQAASGSTSRPTAAA